MAARVLDLREGYQYVEDVSKHVKNFWEQYNFQSYMDNRDWSFDLSESEDSMHASFDWLKDNCPRAAVAILRGMSRMIRSS